MIELRELGQLGISAASGLVQRGEQLYVVSDDELAMAIVDVGAPESVRLLPLSDEELPEEHAARKAAKPDLEALAELPGPALLAIGSGATERRERGWLWGFEGEPVEVSLSELYAALRSELADLNIEGAAVVGERLWLAQRGNGAEGANALVSLDLGHVLDSLRRDAVVPADALDEIRACQSLGEVQGVPLTLSDLAPFDDRLLFCAVAEDSESTYYDGPCVGAAVGVLDPSDGSFVLRSLPAAYKVEGITASNEVRDEVELLLVADPDDRAVPSPLLAARVRF